MLFSPELGAVIFGLLSAVSWGAGDFSGGFISKRLPVVRVIAVSHLFGLALLVVLAVLSGEALPAGTDFLWAAAAAIAGLVGLVTLYRGLSVGRMGIVAPVSGVMATALPVMLTIFTRGLPDSIQLAGFGLGMAGIWLVSQTNDDVHDWRGIGLALVAGVAFGLFFILFDRIESRTVIWLLVAARTVSCGVSVSVALRGGGHLFPRERSLLLILLAVGLLDVGGNAFFLLATQFGRLDIAAVISSLYPASTIILARLVLKEQVNRTQIMGIVAALVAITLIAVG